MTTDQDHIVTMLLIKHGGFANLVDLWLYANENLSKDEIEAVSQFLEDDRQAKPHDAKLKNSDEYPYITFKLRLERDTDS